MQKLMRLVLFWISATACATARPASSVAPSNQASVVPSNQTVIAETEPVFDAQEIYVVNNSSVPIVVTSVWLRDCQNVREPCTQVRVQIPVAPGNRRRIATVHAADNSQAFSYHYSWTWSASGSH